MNKGGVECENCGGTDFYKEAGYYYCTECQIQTQDIQEHVFEDQAQAVDLDKIRSKEKTTAKKSENRITSWEAYNYILLGLTNELIELGANPQLKSVVKIIWFKYLEKIQVIKRDTNITPRIGTTNKNDAAIVYGLKRRKRKRSNSTKSSSSEDVDSSLLNAQLLRRESARKKRALIKAYSEQYSQKTHASDSLLNETLTSVPSSSDKSARKGPRLVLNKYLMRALHKKFTAKHIRAHRSDVYDELQCHRITGRKLGRYVNSAVCLSPNKLYVFLNVALRILKDKIQLGDILRFIDDGHLSINNYSHFYPEDFYDKTVNLPQNKITWKLTWSGLHTQSLNVARVVGIVRFLAKPDLIELAGRYCRELNLPSEFCVAVQNVISRTRIGENYFKKRIQATNYEGRVLCIILVLLKLFFGLDDATEYSYAKLANLVNLSKAVKPKMFDIIAWLKHLEYRRLLIQHYHYPASGNEVQAKDLDAFVGLFARRRFAESAGKRLRDDLCYLLEKLAPERPKNVAFPASLTPFREYARLLSEDGDLRESDCLLGLLEEDYGDCSLEIVLRPAKILEVLNGPDLVHGGANKNIKYERIRDLDAFKERKRMVFVELTTGEEDYQDCGHAEVSSDDFIAAFEKECFQNYNKNLERMKKVSEGSDLAFGRIRRHLKGSEAYKTHYLPYERYWLRFFPGVTDEYDDFFDKFPSNFKLVFRECQRISRQSLKVFMEQFILTEVYLVYADDRFGYSDNDLVVKKYLKKNMRLW